MSLTLHTTTGPIKIELRNTGPIQARHAENFLRHAAMGSYNNVRVLRYIPDFILQTGDPTNTGKQSPMAHRRPLGQYVAPEFERISPSDIVRGTLMTVSNPETSYGSQFFFVLSGKHSDELGGGYVDIGRVIDGMAAVEAIEREIGENVRPNGKVRGEWKESVWIESVTVHYNPFAKQSRERSGELERSESEKAE